MKRAVIFAHWDNNLTIDDYVVYYLKELKKVIEKVIFVSANNLSENETKKLDGIADNIIAKHHNEYDFGSYKRGFEILKAEGLSNYEEIIFANDSCYAPLFSLDKLFEEMEEKECDFWGITKNNYGLKGKNPHTQTYFIAFRKNVFMDNDFIKFISSVKPELDKNSVIENYEIGLSKMLFQNGYKAETFVKEFENISNPTIKKWKSLITKSKSPFLKCSVLRLKNTDYTTADGWHEVIGKTNYPIELIENNLKRTQEKLNTEPKLPTGIKEFLYNSLNYLPQKLRVPFINLVKKVFSSTSSK